MWNRREARHPRTCAPGCSQDAGSAPRGRPTDPAPPGAGSQAEAGEGRRGADELSGREDRQQTGSSVGKPHGAPGAAPLAESEALRAPRKRGQTPNSFGKQTEPAAPTAPAEQAPPQPAGGPRPVAAAAPGSLPARSGPAPRRPGRSGPAAASPWPRSRAAAADTRRPATHAHCGTRTRKPSRRPEIRVGASGASARRGRGSPRAHAPRSPAASSQPSRGGAREAGGGRGRIRRPRVAALRWALSLPRIPCGGSRRARGPGSRDGRTPERAWDAARVGPRAALGPSSPPGTLMVSDLSWVETGLRRPLGKQVVRVLPQKSSAQHWSAENTCLCPIYTTMRALTLSSTEKDQEISDKYLL